MPKKHDVFYSSEIPEVTWYKPLYTINNSYIFKIVNIYFMKTDLKLLMFLSIKDYNAMQREMYRQRLTEKRNQFPLKSIWKVSKSM